MQFLVPPADTLPTGGMKAQKNWARDQLNYGVLNEDGSFISSAQHFRSGRLLTNEAALLENFHSISKWDHLPGSWFYGGIIFAHFGHYLTESVHRLVEYIGNEAEYEGIVFLKAPFRGDTTYEPLEIEFIREVLSGYFGINPAKIQFIDCPTKVDELVCVAQQQQLSLAPNAGYLERLTNLTNEYMKNASPSKPGDEKIFLSRRKFLKAGRTLGMGAVERLFEENGFKMVFPEDLPFSTQLSLVYNAHTLVVEAGSAVHVLDLLGPIAGDLVILSRRGRDSTYWTRLYQQRVKSVLVMDDVMPLHVYTGHSAGAGHSLLNPIAFSNFVSRLNLKVDPVDFLEHIRIETFSDMKELGICLPH